MKVYPLVGPPIEVGPEPGPKPAHTEGVLVPDRVDSVTDYDLAHAGMHESIQRFLAATGDVAITGFNAEEDVNARENAVT